MPITADSDIKKKDKIETLLIIAGSGLPGTRKNRIRAKGIDDEWARGYDPGEEIRISGSPKLQLLATKAATRDLSFLEVNGYGKLEKNFNPNLNKMKNEELDVYADSLNIDVSGMKRSEKIAQIKEALKNVD